MYRYKRQPESSYEVINWSKSFEIMFTDKTNTHTFYIKTNILFNVLKCNKTSYLEVICVDLLF